jgi:hypothetical protein
MARNNSVCPLHVVQTNQQRVASQTTQFNVDDVGVNQYATYSQTSRCSHKQQM